jgi:Protein of unknown function (DUF4236)
MGFLRFRRTFRIGPGLRLNLSKSGVSASVGRRGLWLTVGPRGTRETIGLPGTGISYTEQQNIAAPPGDDPPKNSATAAPISGAPASSSAGLHALVWLALLVAGATVVVVAIAIWA